MLKFFKKKIGASDAKHTKMPTKLSKALVGANVNTLIDKELVFSMSGLKIRAVIEPIVDEFKNTIKDKEKRQSTAILLEETGNSKMMIYMLKGEDEELDCPGGGFNDTGLSIMLKLFEDRINWFYTPSGLHSKEEFIKHVCWNVEDNCPEDPDKRYYLMYRKTHGM